MRHHGEAPRPEPRIAIEPPKPATMRLSSEACPGQRVLPRSTSGTRRDRDAGRPRSPRQAAGQALEDWHFQGTRGYLQGGIGAPITSQPTCGEEYGASPAPRTSIPRTTTRSPGRSRISSSRSRPRCAGVTGSTCASRLVCYTTTFARSPQELARSRCSAGAEPSHIVGEHSYATEPEQE
jgi:hypothetical protein